MEPVISHQQDNSHHGHVAQVVDSNSAPDKAAPHGTGVQNHLQHEVPMTGVIFQEQEIGTTVKSIPSEAQSATGIGLEQYSDVSEKFPLLDRIDPILPPPLTGSMDGYSARDTYADGFAYIDQLSAMECVLSPFQAMDEVPKQHREVFARAMEKILTRLSENQEDGEELDRALKWWFFIPQALLRKAVRGGRAGMGLVKKRFDCIINENYGELVNLWIRDREIAKKKKRRSSSPDRESVASMKTRQAVSLISRGYISKATNRITSNGVASLSDPISKAALQSKYPKRGRNMPAQVTKGLAVDSMMPPREAFLTLKCGIAPGTGQLRP